MKIKIFFWDMQDDRDTVDGRLDVYGKQVAGFSKNWASCIFLSVQPFYDIFSIVTLSLLSERVSNFILLIKHLIY